MKIDRVTLTHVRIPLTEPFRISSGEIAEKDAILVGVSAGGVTGFGEASPMSGSFYSSETPESVWKELSETIVPAVLKKRADSVSSANKVLKSLKASAFAKAGMETAFWDLEGQQSGKPLWKLLGGSERTLESGLAVGIYPSIAQLLNAISRWMTDGYKRIKVKIQPGWDVGPLEAIRKEFGSISLMVDANAAYSEKDIPHLQNLDDFGLMMIEQPLPRKDLRAHAFLQSRVKTPVCLDESAEDAESVLEAINIKACRVINIKIQRVGGLQNAKEIHDICGEAEIPVWGGTMPELGIGGAQTLHLATLPNFRYPTDVESSLRWFVDDIVDPLIRAEKGAIRVAEGAGNGYTLRRKSIQRYMVAEKVFK